MGTPRAGYVVLVSWDLYVVPQEHAEDPGEWLESLVDEPGDAERARDHARLVKARRPELEEFAPDDSGMIELSAPEESGLPFQVLLDGRHAGINVAYWDMGNRADELAALVEDVVTALTAQTGWIPFDPQEDRALDVHELRTTFSGGHARGVGYVREIVAEEASESRPSLFRRLWGGH
jgi:hypothetical protein